MSAAAEEREIGSFVAGKYRLIRVLGRGGMGVVYEAEHSMTKRRVAVKVLHAHHLQTGDAGKRFINEAQAAGRVSHPNVVEVLDAGEESDRSLYLVLELLQGHDLATVLMRQRRIDVADAITIIAQVLQALAVAHAGGIVHRDIKPENIFLTRTVAGDQHVKILDFGISKAMNPGDGQALNVTQTNTTVGTPHYMSPEQARGERGLDARADLWAVGVVLYECLSGRVPFDGETYNDQIVKVITEPHPPLSSFDVPLELSRIVDRALEKDRTRRYLRAADMLEDVRLFIERHREYAAVPANVLRAPQNLPEPPSPSPTNKPTVETARDPAFDFGSDTVRSPAVVSLYDTASEDVPTTVRALDQDGNSQGLRPLAGSARADRGERARAARVTGPGALFRGPNRSRNVAIAVILVSAAVLAGGAAALLVSHNSHTPDTPSQATVTIRFAGMPANARLIVGGVPIYNSSTAFVPRGNRPIAVEIQATGYAPFRFDLVPDDNHTVPINMQRLLLPPVPTPIAPSVRPTPVTISRAPAPPPATPIAVVEPGIAPPPGIENTAPQQTSPQPTPPSEPRTQRNSARAPAEHGSLMVSSPSRCEVSVDGRRAGATPVRMSLAPGDHVVRCLTPPARIRTQNVTIANGQISTVSFD
ncbi:MAG: serine/threonine-protein kinase [Deltaproteobacteria bacterium]|nr:serine/threonine-protein kinase [Deltaproteobacteria bacterium]